jgi:hypothetical protein
MNNREEFIKGLRDIADFFEDRPELPIPNYGESFYIWEKSLVNARERAIQMAPAEKIYLESYFNLQRRFGPHKVVVSWARDAICERVQVGTKHVPAYTVEAHEEPVYEWDCGQPILGSDKQLEKGESL